MHNIILNLNQSFHSLEAHPCTLLHVKHSSLVRQSTEMDIVRYNTNNLIRVHILKMMM